MIFCPHLYVVKTWLALKSNLVAVIQPMPYKLKASWPCPITSAFPWCRLLRPWAACPTTARAGGSKRTCFPCRCTKARMRSYRHLSNFQQEI